MIFLDEEKKKFSYFCFKHRLWVHVKTASNEAVQTSTHYLCFRAKIRNPVFAMYM